ncbi:MAG TPA: hypothetical protein VH723_10800, partial [Candidatus Limnocylindrales bacterium]
VTAALATLRSRWGTAAPRLAGEAGGVGEVVGALATAPLPDALPEPAPPPGLEGIVSTGFPALDAILGPGGLPRAASVAVRGTGWSGKTTLALRLVAEAQAAGSIVAWLDLGRCFDPVEAVARGVRLEWLVVVTPEDLDEGFSIAGMLLAGRAVDLLVVDLPPRPGRASTPAKVADRLHRLSALARRSETLVVLLEPPTARPALGNAVAEATGIRLELARREWIRLGREVVGQRSEVVVARNRFGPPGRRAELRILYADGGDRDACLGRAGLLDDAPVSANGISTNATAPPLLATPAARPRPSPQLRLVPDRPGRPRRPAVDRRDGDRRGRSGPRARRATGDPARDGAPARA